MSRIASPAAPPLCVPSTLREGWRRFLAVGLLLTASLFGCRVSPEASTQKDGELPRHETLYIGGRQWGEPSQFNPLDGSPHWPTMNGFNMLYETLLMYNQLDGKLYPLLAESHAIKEDSIEVVVNGAAHWNDGKPVTGWDVKYTFDLGKQHKGLLWGPVWNYISEVRLPEEEAGTAIPGGYPRKVVFVLNEKRNRLRVVDQLVETRIVPRHVIEPLMAKAGGSLDEFLKFNFKDNPVGSGPYKLYRVESEKIVAIRDDNYWGNQAMHGGKKPAPKYIVHAIYKGNEHFSTALQQGRLDSSASFIPRIWRKYPKGVRTWYDDAPFQVPASIPMLYVNVTEAPLDDPAYRRAMAFAIQYDDIRELAVSRYSDPLRPGMILPFGQEARYFSEEDTKKYGTFYSPERAKAELAAAGYKAIWDEDGNLLETRDKTGRRVRTVYIKSPTGWSDWEQIVRIAVRGMRSVGIDAREGFVDASLFWGALWGGDFDLIMWKPHPIPAISEPWSRFEEVLTSNDWAPPKTEKMYKNMGRFNNPKSPRYVARIDELLNLIPQLTDQDELTKAYRELNRIYMQLQPTIPLAYLPDNFYEFSVKHWQNFPNQKNPYLPPQLPGDRMGAQILWELKPVGAPAEAKAAP